MSLSVQGEKEIEALALLFEKAVNLPILIEECVKHRIDLPLTFPDAMAQRCRRLLRREKALCVDQSGFDAAETRKSGVVPSAARKGAA